jgi:hypothetical protein
VNDWANFCLNLERKSCIVKSSFLVWYPIP